MRNSKKTKTGKVDFRSGAALERHQDPATLKNPLSHISVDTEESLQGSRLENVFIKVALWKD